VGRGRGDGNCEGDGREQAREETWVGQEDPFSLRLGVRPG
jgi:hypothetical protein